MPPWLVLREIVLFMINVMKRCFFGEIDGCSTLWIAYNGWCDLLMFY